jgi:copper chaperone CopZ
MTVVGMTCDHCVLSVREEVGAIPGIESVDVDLASGRLTISGTGYTSDHVRNAVAEAGYEVIA